MRQVGYSLELYRDARSPEYKMINRLFDSVDNSVSTSRLAIITRSYMGELHDPVGSCTPQ